MNDRGASWISLICLSLAVASCQSSPALKAPAKVAPASEVVAAPEVRPQDYAAIFDAVVAKVEKHHAFAPGVRDTWNADKPELRLQFVQAKTDEQATTALFHLQNALRDAHCYVTWPEHEVLPASLGLRVFAQPRASSVFESQVLISKIDNPMLTQGDDALAIGDEIIAVDGVAVADWMRANRWNGDSNTLNAISWGQGLADSIVSGSDVTSNTQHGDDRKLTMKRGSRTWDRTLSFAAPIEDLAETIAFVFDEPTSVGDITCRGESQSPYADFELTAVGVNLCIYKPKKSAKAIDSRARLVRFFLFMYRGEEGDSSRYLRVDHDTLKRELTLASAVVLDVHENPGGVNPYIFMGWFAGKPWHHRTEHFQISAGLTDAELMTATNHNTVAIERYKQLLAAGKSEMVGPFICNHNGKKQLTGICPPQGPLPTQLVTQAPVAVIVGPQCASSCDSLAEEWSSSKLGPVLGLQPQRGFTSVRHAFPVKRADGSQLGVLRVALTWAEGSATQRSIEGVPMKLDWEAPYTFATRSTWIDAAVSEALRRIGPTR
jgi:hypothetical protein